MILTSNEHTHRFLKMLASESVRISSPLEEIPPQKTSLLEKFGASLSHHIHSNVLFNGNAPDLRDFR